MPLIPALFHQGRPPYAHLKCHLPNSFLISPPTSHSSSLSPPISSTFLTPQLRPLDSLYEKDFTALACLPELYLNDTSQLSSLGMITPLYIIYSECLSDIVSIWASP